MDWIEAGNFAPHEGNHPTPIVYMFTLIRSSCLASADATVCGMRYAAITSRTSSSAIDVETKELPDQTLNIRYR